MAMLIAALAAEGTSTIGNVGQIDRGYERIDERLRALGANIERVEASGAPPAPARAAGRRRRGNVQTLGRRHRSPRRRRCATRPSSRSSTTGRAPRHAPLLGRGHRRPAPVRRPSSASQRASRRLVPGRRAPAAADAATSLPAASSALTVKEYVCPAGRRNHASVRGVVERSTREGAPSRAAATRYAAAPPLHVRCTRSREGTAETRTVGPPAPARRRRDVDHAVAELRRPAPESRGGPFEDLRDRRGAQRRVRRPDERRRAGHLGRRERRSARVAVEAVATRACERHARVERRRRGAETAPKHVHAGRDQRDVRAGVREGRVAPSGVEAPTARPTADAVGADRLEQCGGILGRVAALALVAGGGHE